MFKPDPNAVYTDEEVAKLINRPKRYVRKYFPWGRVSGRVWLYKGQDLLNSLPHAPVPRVLNECTGALPKLSHALVSAELAQLSYREFEALVMQTNDERNAACSPTRSS